MDINKNEFRFYMEKEPVIYSVEDKFRQQIDERYGLWTSITDDSKVNNETKEKIKQVLLNFKENAFKEWADIDDAFYGIVSSILTITDRDDNKSEGKTLFENLRDDIWALLKEIKS